MKNVLSSIFFIIFLFLETAIILGQSTLYLRPHHEEGKDKRINSVIVIPPDGTEFIANAWTWNGVPGNGRSAIEFDLSDIPNNADVLHADLFLFAAMNPPSGNHSNRDGSNTALLQRITSDWTENTLIWQNQPSTTTDNEVIIPASSDPLQNYQIDITRLVEDIIEDGKPNYGFMFRLVNENYYRRMNFATSNHPDTTLHPILIVEFESQVKDPILHGFKICPGKKTILESSATGTGLLYLWNNGSNNDTIQIYEPGVYSVTTTFPNEAPLVDSFNITPDSNPALTTDSIVLCQGNNIEISSRSISPSNTYLWSTGDTTYSIIVSEPGIYEVTSDFELLCPYKHQFFIESISDLLNIHIFVPTAFSPNDDGVNEVLIPFIRNIDQILKYEMKIYNRWGHKVFESLNPDFGWNGLKMDKPLPTGTYVWTLYIAMSSCGENFGEEFLTGDILLIR